MSDIDFIYLDNSLPEQFDDEQMKWFISRIAADKASDLIHAVVVGMHAALPYSISEGHSMNQSPQGIKSGLQVYSALLDLDKKKKVYVLASHSHYFMENIFNTQYWHSNGGVLRGWIVGTGGAHRYMLPEPNAAGAARTNVYGYLLGTVNPSGQPSGTIQFDFKPLEEKDIPGSVVHGFGQDFVHWCFTENSDAKAGDATGSGH
jgi:hypothetical protein